MSQLRNARCVHVFWPMNEKREVNIRPVIRQLFDSGTTILMPIIDGPVLRHGIFQGEQELRQGPFGVQEPFLDDTQDLPSPDVVLVPALAIDRSGNRVGYGKGYYDSFLNGLTASKIVPLFSNQVVDGIPSEPHDVSVDILVTEQGAFAIE